jgi:hypothetical protein
VAEAVTALEACRDAARSAKAAGSAGEAAALLSRFASTGVAMLGAKLVGQGETGAGLKVWGDGETFASQDKPGFKLGLKSLRGY